MARTPQVTRTMHTTDVVVLCADLETAELYNEEITLPRVYQDSKKLFKVVAKELDVEEKTKVVQIVSTETKETLYGMDEQTFIKNAQILEKR